MAKLADNVHEPVL